MKPLLRAVLIVDAGLYLSSGAALLLSPLAGVQRALQLTPIEPAMVGQMLGLALLGLAWLSLRGALDGAMTVGVAKIVGHVTWLAGALVLAWTIGPHKLWLPALGIVPNLLIGGLLVVVGLGGARFAGAVRRREIGKAAKASNEVAKTKERGKPVPATAVPVEPVLQPSQPVGMAETGPRTERVFSASPASGVGSEDTSAAASGSGDVRAAQPASAPRPPFHG
ncbi:hypothetical protein AB1286_00655 [Trinickia sp. NRRL B-1857]|uniref:hypothetical protein n=1 Tax=Trinickia sp. NRRL B-1857 TaxID=3162879 RepID=UPI003D27AF77